MSSSSSSVFSLAPYHIICYATLTGTTFFHSFINGIVMFRTIPRPQFAAVQGKLFPIYFSLQTGLPILCVLTYPGTTTASSISGVLDPTNRFTVLLPLATICITALANLAVLLPATSKVMQERRDQEKKDDKSYDKGPHSEEMKALNKRFGMLHGVSSLLNLGSFLGCIGYAFTLAGRMA